jgi:MFS family permease
MAEKLGAVSQSKDRSDPEHNEQVRAITPPLHEKNGILLPEDFTTTAAALPTKYFRSSYFIGSWFATGMSIGSAWAAFSFVLPILGDINNDIGPDANINWVAIVYTLGLSVGLVIVGRTSDILGRRWFFIIGSLLGLIGSIVNATATNVPTLIAGQTLIGLGATTGLSYPLILGELVPMKYRFIAGATVYMFAIPTNCLGGGIATAFVLYTEKGWRWSYYLCIIFNAIAALSWYFFYHPPNFYMKWHQVSKLQVVKKFDYVGMFLYTAGLVLFLLGLSWGGAVYPWKSATVICTIVLGCLTLIAFGLWELYAPLGEPLVPMQLFRRKGYLASCLLLALAASIYYAFSLLWPQMVVVIYPRPDRMWGGWISCLVGAGVAAGEIVGGCFCEKIGKLKHQCMVAIIVGGTFLAG